MHKAIFSDKEREMAEHYLSTGEKRPGFRTLAFRVRKVHIQINEDYELMVKLLKKIQLLATENDEE